MLLRFGDMYSSLIVAVSLMPSRAPDSLVQKPSLPGGGFCLFGIPLLAVFCCDGAKVFMFQIIYKYFDILFKRF